MHHILSLGRSSLKEPIGSLLRERGLTVRDGVAGIGESPTDDMIENADVVLLHVGADCHEATDLCSIVLASESTPPLISAADHYDAKMELALLDAGVDDHWAPPAALDSLLVRIELRSRTQQAQRRYRVGAIEVDEGLQEAFVEQTACGLTRREFTLLSALAKHPARVISRAELLKQWGFVRHGGSNLVDVHVARLRGKLRSGARQLQTVRGRGFQLNTVTSTD